MQEVEKLNLFVLFFVVFFGLSQSVFCFFRGRGDAIKFINFFKTQCAKNFFSVFFVCVFVFALEYFFLPCLALQMMFLRIFE